VLKKRNRILLIAPEYSLSTQARLVAGLIAVHNFIRVYDPEDLPEPDEPGQGDNTNHDGADIDLGNLQSGISTDERQRANRKRDEIALSMWEDYKNWKRHRGRRQRN
jgi:hypothetical protein